MFRNDSRWFNANVRKACLAGCAAALALTWGCTRFGFRPVPRDTGGGSFDAASDATGQASADAGANPDAIGSLDAGASADARDAAGLNLDASDGGVRTDLVPPHVSGLWVANVPTASDAPTQAELIVPAGQPLYVRWAADDDEGLAAQPISLYYIGTDEVPVLITDALLNGANGSGCTVPAGMTGCDIVQSPSSSAFRVRLLARDQGNNVAATTSTFLNSGDLRLLAGNLDDGIDASARGALFFSDAALHREADTGSLVVTEQGWVFFRDFRRGLLMIDPADGVLRMLCALDPNAASGSGDGGPARDALLKDPLKIALDYNDGLLIFDYDRIRRIDLSASPMTIETVIGGGAATTDGIAPDQVQITVPYTGTARGRPPRQMPLFALPNGDIYFQSDGYARAPVDGFRVRIYRSQSGLVGSLQIPPGSTGDSYVASQDLTRCPMDSFALAFDPQSSAIQRMQLSSRHAPDVVQPDCGGAWIAGQVNLDPAGTVVAPPSQLPPGMSAKLVRIVGRDGQMYAVDRENAVVMHHSPADDTWQAIIGTGEKGSCTDGTRVLECPIDPLDVFVSTTGTIYFVDGGRVRTVETATGTVQTVMGQSFSDGDGGAPLAARFSQAASDVQPWSSVNGSQTHIIVLDREERRMREFVAGGTIATIAGNGSATEPDTVALATDQGLIVDYVTHGVYMFGVDSNDGRVYFNRGPRRVAQLDRMTGRWIDIIGNGTIPYASADGEIGQDIDLSSSRPPIVLGITDTYLLVGKGQVGNDYLGDLLLKRYRLDDQLIQDPLAGVAGVDGSGVFEGAFCADGTIATACTVPLPVADRLTHAVYDATGDRWLIARINATGPTEIRILPGDPTAAVGTLATLTQPIRAFAYRREESPLVDIIYYCGADGRIYRHRAINGVETPLSWPVPLLQCQGRGMVYAPSIVDAQGRNTAGLIFTFRHGGTSGVAQYLLY